MDRRVVALGGEELHYADFGGRGRAMVLVHGLGGSHVNWTAVGQRLAERRRVVALDLPGFGLSPRGVRGTTIEVMREALVRFIEHISPEPVELVGNSMGGALTALAAASARGRVEKAVLVCPALPPGLPFGAWARHHLLGSKKRRLFAALLLLAAAPFGDKLVARRFATAPPEKVVTDMMNLCCVDASRVPRAAVEEMIALARTRATRPWSDIAFSEATRSITTSIIGKPEAFYRELERIADRTLIIHGADDQLVDVSAARAAKQRCPGVELVVFDGVGHTPQLEVPERFVATMLGWLENDSLFGSGKNVAAHA